MPRYAKSEQVPTKMRERDQEIVALTDAFCQERLDQEYAQLARQATARRLEWYLAMNLGLRLAPICAWLAPP
jgi:hypothetical protein